MPTTYGRAVGDLACVPRLTSEFAGGPMPRRTWSWPRRAQLSRARRGQRGIRPPACGQSVPRRTGRQSPRLTGPQYPWLTGRQLSGLTGRQLPGARSRPAPCQAPLVLSSSQSLPFNKFQVGEATHLLGTARSSRPASVGPSQAWHLRRGECVLRLRPLARVIRPAWHYSGRGGVSGRAGADNSSLASPVWTHGTSPCSLDRDE